MICQIKALSVVIRTIFKKVVKNSYCQENQSENFDFCLKIQESSRVDYLIFELNLNCENLVLHRVVLVFLETKNLKIQNISAKIFWEFFEFFFQISISFFC